MWPVVFTTALRAPGWNCNISYGLLALQRVGTSTSDLCTSHSLKRRNLFHWEREDHTASPTWSSQCHIPNAAFPTMDQTQHTVLPWQKSKEVGDHMSKVLPSTQDRLDLQQIPQLGHSPQVMEIGSELGCRKTIWSHLSNLKYLGLISSYLFYFINIIISRHLRTVCTNTEIMEWKDIFLQVLYVNIYSTVQRS